MAGSNYYIYSFKFSRLKQLLAITLVIVHLFNVAGYHLVFDYFIGKAETQLVKQLDKNLYSDDELIELKVPLHLPYVNNSSYTRVDGEIEIDGKHYNFVKRKVSNDTLYVMCLPNATKTKLEEARNQVNGQAADMNTSGKNNETAKKSQPTNEYNQASLAWHVYTGFQLLQPATATSTPKLLHPFLDSGFQPPDHLRA